MKLEGKAVTVGFLTDAASGQIVGIELLSSREGERLGRWLAEAAQAFGAQVVVTDELGSYKVATETAAVDYQLCLAHMRKAVALRMLTLDLLENWGRLTLYQQDYEPFLDNLGRPIARRYSVPATDNATGNAIGRGDKLRAKRMRGVNRHDTIIPLLMLVASLSEVLAGVPFHLRSWLGACWRTDYSGYNCGYDEEKSHAL